MLQWMGGSRRKIKTSKISMQNKLRQYFAQRKGNANPEGALIDISRENENMKSLDIDSLMDICLTTECITHNQNSLSTGQEKEAILHTNTYRLEHIKEHSSADRSIADNCGSGIKVQRQDTLSKVDAATQWTPSAFQSTVSFPNVNNSELTEFKGTHAVTEGKEHQMKNTTKKNNFSPKRTSIIDIISDSINEGSVTSPAEVYAAFAVEGVGNIRNQTPDVVKKEKKTNSISARKCPPPSVPKGKYYEKTPSRQYPPGSCHIWKDVEETGFKNLTTGRRKLFQKDSSLGNLKSALRFQRPISIP